jgi:hypothetical protein
MTGLLGKSRFVVGRTVPTLAWGREGGGFHTRISLFNYYSLLFEDRPVRCRGRIYLFDERGREAAAVERELGPLEQWQFELGSAVSSFQGTIAVQLIPDWLPDLKHDKYVGTLFFAVYRDEAGHCDYTHETDRMRFEDDGKEQYESTAIPTSEDLDFSIVVQNSYFGDDEGKCDRTFDVQMRDAAGRPLLETTLELGPRESRVIPLSQLGPDVRAGLAGRPGSVHVSGRHINQPLTLQRHRDGDFNIHHF